MGAIFSVRAKYQTFHKKEKMSSHGIYVSSRNTADIAKTKIPKQCGIWTEAKIRHFIYTYNMGVSSLFLNS